ncbi:hypothetical protein GGQ11_002778 [Salinibacter ruber]|uniref:hypothetical protein n=1 Tax=Salinibacter ruber TaxID=146919 RepID=UPI0021693AD9|nr:hypothetical protein [Salinibacter ruber]MCS3657977.1 hypothetical protein [Salinibacter ruber]
MLSRTGKRGASPSQPFVVPSTTVVGVFVGAALLGLLTPNPLLTAGALLLVPVLIRLLWRRGETPILLFAVLYQWLQVTTRLFYADIQGVPLGTLASHAPPAQVREATGLGMIGLLILAGGAHLILRHLGPSRSLSDGIKEFSIWRLFLLYLALVAYEQFLPAFAGLFGPLSEILVPAAQTKWVLFFLLGYACIRRREGYSYLAVAVAIEFVLGIGYFAGFKTVFLFLAVIVFAAQVKVSGRMIAVAAVFAGGLLILGSIWMTIRNEYRAFLNQGTNQQVVRVSRMERLQKAYTLASNVSLREAVQNVEAVAVRLSYVDLFAATLDYVPEQRSHSEGGLWGQAVQHVLMPRLLFPGKAILPSDSELTMKYTGIHFASGAQGTSVSMGYMAESYIDFGRYGMYFPILLLGAGWGAIYCFFVSRATINVIGHGFATAVLFNASRFEMTSLKLVGGVLTAFIVLALIQTYVVPQFLPWLMDDSTHVES